MREKEGEVRGEGVAGEGEREEILGGISTKQGNMTIIYIVPENIQPRVKMR